METPTTLTLGEQIDAVAERVTELLSELDAKEQEIAALREERNAMRQRAETAEEDWQTIETALRDLVSAHEGYTTGMGPCVCAAHEAARTILHSPGARVSQ